MIDDEHRQRHRLRLGTVAGLTLAALVVVRVVLHRVLGIDLPDVDLPSVNLPDVDLPDWLRWAGPVLGVGKLLFLIGLGVLAVLGEWERHRRRDSDGGSR